MVNRPSNNKPSKELMLVKNNGFNGLNPSVIQAKRLMRLTSNSFQCNMVLNSKMIEVGSLFSRVNSIWPFIMGIRPDIVANLNLYNGIYCRHMSYTTRC